MPQSLVATDKSPRSRDRFIKEYHTKFGGNSEWMNFVDKKDLNAYETKDNRTYLLNNSKQNLAQFTLSSPRNNANVSLLSKKEDSTPKISSI